MKKRILPALLALCMVMSLLPVAFAEPATECEYTTEHTTCTFTGTGHKAGCPQKCACTKVTGKVEGKNCEHDSGECTATKQDGNTDNLCSTCATNKAASAATTPGTDDETEENTKVLCRCDKHDSWVDESGENPVVSTRCKNEATGNLQDAAGGNLCASCLRTATCNPCGVGGCTLLARHTGNHNNESCLTPASVAPQAEVSAADKALCGAKTHNAGCPNKCDLDADAWSVKADAPAAPAAAGEEGEEEEGTEEEEKPVVWEKDGKESCNLTKGHTGPHANSKCIKDGKCGAATHAPDCPVASASGQCGKGGCTKAKGHTDDHNNSVCLGANDDEHCTAENHIAGCSKYECEGCNHSQVAISYHGKQFKAFTGDPEDCTSKAGCAFCDAWNAYISSTNAALRAEFSAWLTAYNKLTDAQKENAQENPVPTAPTYLTAVCKCKDCTPNPALGTVEGETVTDPANPTDPTEPTTPEKAEEFTDMEDWMAADVQVMLDKGWMEGVPGGKFEGREDSTGEMVATVIARMLGADVKGGDEWRDSLNAWIDENADLVEGIEITNGAMARKDVVLMLWRQAGKPSSDFELKFEDVDGLEGDYLTAMKWAAENGIVKGNPDNTANPDGNVRRAELAALAARYDALEK